MDAATIRDLQDLELSFMTDRAAIKRRPRNSTNRLQQGIYELVEGMGAVPCSIVSIKSAPGILRNPVIASFMAQNSGGTQDPYFASMPVQVGGVPTDVQKGDQFDVTRNGVFVVKLEVKNTSGKDTIQTSIMLNCEGA